MDLREKNSWNYLLHEVPTAEAVEVHCVNALAPMVETFEIFEFFEFLNFFFFF